MRQAGRYLPEYRAVRSRYKQFLDFVADPEAAAQVTVQPIERFGLDAAILFSDILVGLRPIGLDLSFEEQKGPVVANPVRSHADVHQLKPLNVIHDLSYTREAIEKTLALLPQNIPLLGFVGGPFTVASYAIEGRSSKELKETKKLLYSDLSSFHQLMEFTTNYLADYLVAQAEWGCSALVIMDSWAGYLSPSDYAHAALPYMRRLVQAVRTRTQVPLILYANGAGHLLPQLTDLQAHAVGLDWRTDLAQAVKAYPNQIFQGNLDPCTLYAPLSEIESRTRALLRVVQDRPHIMNLGHGMLPDIPIEGVEAFIHTIRNP